MVVTIALVFSAVFLGSFALVLAGANAGQSPAARAKMRLKMMAASSQRKPERDPLLQGNDRLAALTHWVPLMERVKRAVERAGLNVPPLYFALWISAAAFVTFLLFFLAKGNFMVSLFAALAVIGCARFFLAYKKKVREDRFTEQLPDALTMIARSLRAGHSMTGAVELVAQELPDPAGPLFKLAYEQQNLGMRIADSLATIPERIDSIDLRFFVTIIRINTETGGNLSEILDKLADTIRARLQIRRQVQVVTAEGRVSGYVLMLLPIVVFALFYMIQPNYIGLFFTNHTLGMLLIGAAVAQVIGFMFIRKIVNIRI
ncbi:type II secretion system F family protein [Geomonas sp.]|uniref:type II secretion system F family protein n=1 Tax=Geomonas sp. TaxID=2651584 RepID=UPI002B45B2A4|nr:type II secretion system F family protein [Geomonas sp.]HJV36764.1 type II secretion system F family protein [Geomonas sp.]